MFCARAPVKCSYFVTEQLTLQMPERDRGTIQFHQGALPPGAQVVQRGLRSGAPSDSRLSANFLLRVEPLFCFFTSILDRFFMFQRVFNGNRILW